MNLYTYMTTIIYGSLTEKLRKETEARNLSRWRDVPFMNRYCCCSCNCCCHPQIFDFSPTINKTINQSCSTGQTNANTNAKYVAYSINFLFVLTIFEIFIACIEMQGTLETHIHVLLFLWPLLLFLLLLLLLSLHLHASG